MIYHQMISQLDQPMTFFYLHLGLLLLFSLQGVAGWFLTWQLNSRLAWVSRVALLLFIIGYGAFDTLSGLAASLLIARLPTLDGASVIWNDTVTPILLYIGSWGYMVGIGAACLALGRHGRPLPPLIVLALSALLLNKDHGGWRGVLVFGGFFVGALWLEWHAARRSSDLPRTQATLSNPARGEISASAAE
jgi:hypothetical protein